MSTSGSNYREGYVKLLGDDKPVPVDVMTNPAIRTLVNQAQLKGTQGQPLYGALHVAVTTSKNRIQHRVLLLTQNMLIVLYGMERGMLDGRGGPGKIARLIHLSQIREVVVTGQQVCKACLLDMLPVSNDPAFFFKVEDNEVRNGGVTGARQFVNNLVYLARLNCNNYNLAIRVLTDQNSVRRLSGKTMKPSGFLKPKAKLEQIRLAGGVRKFFPPKDADKEREILEDIQRRRYGDVPPAAAQLPASAPPPAYEPAATKEAADLPPPPVPPALPPPPPPVMAPPPAVDYGPPAAE
eukprot:Rhum_TRINITY_DN21008_c0_g1::Rhum_TRINITY_DN21008_c0_g1_i1::g.172898::m.172898